jgi:2-methylcitrate dehydratase PrpD
MQREQLAASDVQAVTARVHQAAIDVLGPVTDPQTVHQSKFSMGTVLGLVAVHGKAGLQEFDRHFQDPAVVEFRHRVRMELDPSVEAAYPARWLGRVLVQTRDGRLLNGAVDEPKGDPGNSLSRPELEDKAIRLAQYRDGATAAEMRALIAATWRLTSWDRVPMLLPAAAI